MNPFQPLSDLAAWAGKELGHSLNLIPDEALRWKPAPGTPSALEIAAEAVKALTEFNAISEEEKEEEDSSSGDLSSPEVSFDTRAQAQNALVSASAAYAQTLLALGEGSYSEETQEEMQLDWGDLPKDLPAMFPIFVTILGRGQIAYLSSLLDSTERLDFGSPIR